MVVYNLLKNYVLTNCDVLSLLLTVPLFQSTVLQVTFVPEYLLLPALDSLLRPFPSPISFFATSGFLFIFIVIKFPWFF